jgi:hypothetical protein
LTWSLTGTTGWLTWGTYGDDYYPVAFGRGSVIGAAKAGNARLEEFMPLDLAAMPLPVTALERGLADLWARTAGPMEPPARHWLAGILNWHRGCHRYAEADLLANTRPALPKLFRGPAGLGTSAARVTRAPGGLPRTASTGPASARLAGAAFSAPVAR